MPAPLDVDHEQVRVLAVAVGVREAARQMGLTENVVLQWSNREGWFKQVPQPQVPATMQKTTVIGVISAADALANSLREDGNATKIAGMKYARRTVEAAAQMAHTEPLMALERAQEVKAALQAAGIAGSWSAGQDGPRLQLNFFTAGGEQAPVIDV